MVCCTVATSCCPSSVVALQPLKLTARMFLTSAKQLKLHRLIFSFTPALSVTLVLMVYSSPTMVSCRQTSGRSHVRTITTGNHDLLSLSSPSWPKIRITRSGVTSVSEVTTWLYLAASSATSSARSKMRPAPLSNFSSVKELAC